MMSELAPAGADQADAETIEGCPSLFENKPQPGVNSARESILGIAASPITVAKWLKGEPLAGFEKWKVFSGDPQANFNSSGTVGIGDLFGFFNAWFAGC